MRNLGTETLTRRINLMDRRNFSTSTDGGTWGWGAGGDVRLKPQTHLELVPTEKFRVSTTTK